MRNVCNKFQVIIVFVWSRGESQLHIYIAANIGIPTTFAGHLDSINDQSSNLTLVHNNIKSLGGDSRILKRVFSIS